MPLTKTAGRDVWGSHGAIARTAADLRAQASASAEAAAAGSGPRSGSVGVAAGYNGSRGTWGGTDGYDDAEKAQQETGQWHAGVPQEGGGRVVMGSAGVIHLPDAAGIDRAAAQIAARLGPSRNEDEVFAAILGDLAKAAGRQPPRPDLPAPPMARPARPVHEMARGGSSAGQGAESGPAARTPASLALEEEVRRMAGRAVGVRAECETLEGMLSSAAADLVREESALSEALSRLSDLRVMTTVLGLQGGTSGEEGHVLDGDEENDRPDAMGLARQLGRRWGQAAGGSTQLALASDVFSRRLEELGVGEQRRAATAGAVLQQGLRQLLLELQEQEMSMAAWMQGSAAGIGEGGANGGTRHRDGAAEVLSAAGRAGTLHADRTRRREASLQRAQRSLGADLAGELRELLGGMGNARGADLDLFESDSLDGDEDRDRDGGGGVSRGGGAYASAALRTYGSLGEGVGVGAGRGGKSPSPPPPPGDDPTSPLGMRGQSWQPSVLLDPTRGGDDPNGSVPKHRAGAGTGHGEDEEEGGAQWAARVHEGYSATLRVLQAKEREVQGRLRAAREQIEALEAQRFSDLETVRRNALQLVASTARGAATAGSPLVPHRGGRKAQGAEGAGPGGARRSHPSWGLGLLSLANGRLAGAAMAAAAAGAIAPLAPRGAGLAQGRWDQRQEQEQGQGRSWSEEPGTEEEGGLRPAVQGVVGSAALLGVQLSEARARAREHMDAQLRSAESAAALAQRRAE